MGRKKVTLKELVEGWQDVAIELYKEGASDVEVKAALARGKFSSISNDLWNRLMKEEDNFSTTIKKGRQLSRVWWEKEGRTNLKTSGYSYTGWYMNMKNRFGWKDKSEVEQTGGLTVVIQKDDKDL